MTARATPFSEAAPGNITDTAHTYADNGTYTVTITVTEEAGAGPGSDSETFPVTVANVDPVVTLLGANSTTEGASEHYTFSITDAGSADTFTVDASDCGANGILTNYAFDGRCRQLRLHLGRQLRRPGCQRRRQRR